MKPAVEIFEVGPRDGLQNEPAFISSEDKIALTEALAGAGLLRVECASFVSPRWVPQMADGAQVVQGVTPGAAQLYALAPNMRGLQAALATPVGGVCVFIAATEGFSRANTNVSLAGAVERVNEVIAAFKTEAPEGVRLRGYISCVTECPYDGPVDPRKWPGLRSCCIARAVMKFPSAIPSAPPILSKWRACWRLWCSGCRWKHWLGIFMILLDGPWRILMRHSSMGCGFLMPPSLGWAAVPMRLEPRAMSIPNWSMIISSRADMKFPAGLIV